MEKEYNIGKIMSAVLVSVVARNNESVESLLRRFTRKCKKIDLMAEIRERGTGRRYTKKSEKRREKSIAAQKRREQEARNKKNRKKHRG